MNILDKLVEVTLPNEESFLKVKETSDPYRYCFQKRAEVIPVLPYLT